MFYLLIYAVADVDFAIKVWWTQVGGIVYHLCRLRAEGKIHNLALTFRATCIRKLSRYLAGMRDAMDIFSQRRLNCLVLNDWEVIHRSMTLQIC